MATTTTIAIDDALELLDWKRRVFSLYAAVRAEPDPRAAWQRWRDARDELFRTHPQSPLPPDARATFGGLVYFDYDPALRVEAVLDGLPPRRVELPSSGPSPMRFEQIGEAAFELGGRMHRLGVHWLPAYGGGLFVPLSDATNGVQTYGGGRYLLDTVKGSDLGAHDGRLVLDLNFAYNPSCSYDPVWTCPLAPVENRFGHSDPRRRAAPGAERVAPGIPWEGLTAAPTMQQAASYSGTASEHGLRPGGVLFGGIAFTVRRPSASP